ncbi:MAG: transposase [Bacillota bacterium]
MPGIGFKMAAMFIFSIKNIDRFDLVSKLARYTGLVSVEHSSKTTN